MYEFICSLNQHELCQDLLLKIKVERCIKYESPSSIAGLAHSLISYVPVLVAQAMWVSDLPFEE